jgi:gamma-glutamyltranspeptidase/glutathione hydrolase
MGKIQFTHRQSHPLSFWLKQSLCLGFISLSTLSFAEIAPESASGFKPISQATSRSQMVVSANNYATDTAVAILNRGGTAVDAAIAAQLVLGLVEPQSSGIGGGGFLLHWQAEQQKLSSFDGRETAPEAVVSTHFLDNSDKPMGFFDAVVGGHSVGTPGLLAMLEQAHTRYGKLPWAELFQPAISLAEQGFLVSPRLHHSLTAQKQRPNNLNSGDFYTLFYTAKGDAVATGTALKNPAYGKTLRAIAAGGSIAFYQGEIAQHIVDSVQNAPRHKGKLSLNDLSNYRSDEKAALCKTVETYTLCGPPPPSAGPLAVIQQLSILAQLPYSQGIAYNSTAFYHRFIESSKMAIADRNRYIADPDFVKIPIKQLLSDDYLQQRSQQVPLLRASKGQAKAGQIANNHNVDSQSPELPSTTHLSIVDSAGNIVSLTSSIEMAFGSQLMVGGFLLNNQLTDFSFIPENTEETLVANRIEAKKRPRSSMSPMIVFKNKQPVLVIGSPGGSRIINYVAQVLFQHLYLDTPLVQAISSSHVTNLNGVTEVEQGRSDSKALQKNLGALGHQVKLSAQTSGLHIIRISPTGLEGVADPRREGTARAE